MTLAAKALAAAEEVPMQCVATPRHVEYGECVSCTAVAIYLLAREFGEKCIRVSLSEYEIHSRGVPERLIEITIEMAERE